MATTLTSVKPKAKFGLKRKLTEKRLERLKKLRIKEGSTTHGEYDLDHELCIMESINLMMHGEDATFSGSPDCPPCVSEVITETMIELNDSVSNKDRQALKRLASQIVGTCPTRYAKRTIRTKKGTEKEIDILTREETNERYKKTEQLRSLIAGGEDRFYGIIVTRDNPVDYVVLEAAVKYEKLINSGKMGDRLNAIRMLIDPMESFTKHDRKLLKEYGVVT